jgi:glycosyltransferase involved in cell wall biosynthesis
MPATSESAPPRKLRIIGVDPERNFAGGESQVMGLTLELMRMGHDAQLLCDPDGLLWQRARAAGVVCNPLKIRNAVDCLAGLRMRRFLSEHRFDVVHFHTSRAHAMAPFAAGRAGTRVVTRRMDYAPSRLSVSLLYNRGVNAVAAISQEVANALRAAGVSSPLITIIPSGVDCRRFAPPTPEQRSAARKALGLTPDQVAIGAVGGLELRKGHRFLLDAIAQLRGTRPALRCFIAGAGSQRYALAEQARRLGLENTVTMLGGIEDSRTLFWAIDIYVQPSIKEGLGVALLEAMACGLAPVASTAGGMMEVIEDQRSGLLVAAADSGALARALGEMIDSPAARSLLGAAARDRIEGNFSIETMARRTLALYQSSLAKC